MKRPDIEVPSRFFFAQPVRQLLELRDELISEAVGKFGQHVGCCTATNQREHQQGVLDKCGELCQVVSYLLLKIIWDPGIGAGHVVGKASSQGRITASQGYQLQQMMLWGEIVLI